MSNHTIYGIFVVVLCALSGLIVGTGHPALVCGWLAGLTAGGFMGAYGVLLQNKRTPGAEYLKK